MNFFDKLVDNLDMKHQDTFSIDVIINGEETTGIFDEETDEFEGTSDIYRTLELPLSALPSTPIVNEESTVFLVIDGRTFTVYKQHRVGKNVILELR